MSSFVKQPLFHPLSVLFVDDNEDFLNGLRGIFCDRAVNRFFTNPKAALDYIESYSGAIHGDELSGADCLAIERGPSNALGKDRLPDAERFEEIAAVVVDYEMPEMDGIRFLSSIRDLPCTKILLTGVAGNREAVDAFNSNLIDFYLRKTDAEMPQKLTNLLADAQKRYCEQRGQVSVHNVGTTYRDPRVKRLLDELAARDGIVEYYWRAGQNAVLMFDAQGDASVFVAWDEQEWAFQCDTVTDAGGPQWLHQAMTERRVMPLFWPEEAYRPDLARIRTTEFHPIPDWPGAFYSVTPLDRSELEPATLSFAQWRQIRLTGAASSSGARL
ncbi:response regulator [Trinickia diaoshuihuensis]|uniref:response regulator n=1 Tax=Trinickia diaoshuihuensis TaxID=2292265 RepID=UPI000E2269DB|nr:response regulator [Trinickia diaoshuihuensis]